MIRRIIVTLTVLVCIALAGCSRVTVGPGEEAVFVKKPYFFGQGGIEGETLKEGSAIVALSTDALKEPTAPFQKTETFDDMVTANKSLVDFRSYLKLRVTNWPDMLKRFGPRWYENNIQEPYRTLMRDTCRIRTQDQLMGDVTELKKADDEASAAVRKLVSDLKMPVVLEEHTIGKVTPNKAVLDEIDATAAQQQRKNTEAQRAAAEVSRKQAENNRAEADNAYRNAMGLNPEQFLRLERIKADLEIAKNVGRAGGMVVLGNAPMTLPLK